MEVANPMGEKQTLARPALNLERSLTNVVSDIYALRMK
jgi:hypothetical protein